MIGERRTATHPSLPLGASRDAPGTLPRCVRPFSRVPSWAVDSAAAAAIGGVAWLIFSRAFLNYDTLYGLIWGRDLVSGRSPDYEVTLAPTPSPDPGPAPPDPDPQPPTEPPVEPPGPVGPTPGGPATI